MSMQLDEAGGGSSGSGISGGGASSASVTNTVQQRMSSSRSRWQPAAAQNPAQRSGSLGSLGSLSPEHSDGTVVGGKYLIEETTLLG